MLLVDVDGVISLFGFPMGERPAGTLHSIEGIPHFLSASAGPHLLELSEIFDIVWATGWEERADEHLPSLLGIPAGLPFLRFERPRALGLKDSFAARLDTGASASSAPGATNAASTGADPAPASALAAHWKLQAIEDYAGTRPLAWIDDAFNDACHEWAATRAAPTLLVQTRPEHGLTDRETGLLIGWARAPSG